MVRPGFRVLEALAKANALDGIPSLRLQVPTCPTQSGLVCWMLLACKRCCRGNYTVGKSLPVLLFLLHKIQGCDSIVRQLTAGTNVDCTPPPCTVQLCQQKYPWTRPEPRKCSRKCTQKEGLQRRADKTCLFLTGQARVSLPSALSYGATNVLVPSTRCMTVGTTDGVRST